MNKIIEIKSLGEYLLLIKFNDGESKTINFELLIGKGISSRLMDREYFQKVSIDNGGGLEWPNGMDFCPNYLKITFLLLKTNLSMLDTNKQFLVNQNII